MATTSTFPTVIDALLTLLNANLPGTVTAYESWPGPDAAAEMVVLGEVTWSKYEIASLKVGRQRRQEDYTVGFEVFVFGTTGTSPTNPKPVRDRAAVLFSEVEDLLADNPKLSLGVTVQQVEPHPAEAGPRVFEKAWAYRVAGQIEVNARLT